MDFFNHFIYIDPLGIFITVIAGIIWGAIFSEFYLDNKTTLILLAFYLPLVITRLIYALAVSSTGAGLTGLIFLGIYALSAVITRYLFRRNRIQKDKLIKRLIEELDRRSNN